MNCYFVTFGCKVNSCETAGMEAILKRAGHEICDDPAMADVILFNSCTVTASGDSRLRVCMRKMRQKFPRAKLVLTGCFPQAYPEQAEAMAEADLILGTKNRSRLPALLEELDSGCSIRSCVEDYTGSERFEQLPEEMDTGHTRAFLKIQDGCNQFCSYCIIPYARGRCRSLPLQAVHEGAIQFAEEGYRELVLCGINLGFYGVQWGGTLADAVEACRDVSGIVRVRLGSLEPERLTPEVLARLSRIETFCPQFHLSLQSGCDRTLARMRRHYTAAQYAEIVAAIRKYFPDAAITTDFMVGFPGESETDFAQSLEFAAQMAFAGVHIFRYSPRKNTKAAAFPNQISEQVKQERMQLAQNMAKQSRRAFLEAQIGKTVSVLFERERGDGFHTGHASNGTIVKVPIKNLKKNLRNQLLCVIIESCEGEFCRGRIASDAISSTLSV